MGEEKRRYKRIISNTGEFIVFDKEEGLKGNLDKIDFYDDEVIDLLNKQDTEIKELKQDLNKKMKFVAKQESESTVQVDFDEFIQLCKDSNDLTEANERIRELEKEIHGLKQK